MSILIRVRPALTQSPDAAVAARAGDDHLESLFEHAARLHLQNERNAVADAMGPAANPARPAERFLKKR
jgi:hypothetical protein